MAETVDLKQNQRKTHPFKNWIFKKNSVYVLILANNSSIITGVYICLLYLLY